MTPRPARPPHADPQPVATTTVLANAARTDPVAADALAARVYARLKAIARKITTGDRAGRDLGPEALIDAAYQKLYLDPIGPREVDRRRWQTGEQFWFEFVLTMKHILIDHARSIQRANRNGGRPTLDLSLIDSDRMYDADPALILDTAAALDKLALRDPAAYEVAVLRHYGRNDDAGDRRRPGPDRLAGRGPVADGPRLPPPRAQGLAAGRRAGGASRLTRPKRICRRAAATRRVPYAMRQRAGRNRLPV